MEIAHNVFFNQAADIALTLENASNLVFPLLEVTAVHGM